MKKPIVFVVPLLAISYAMSAQSPTPQSGSLLPALDTPTSEQIYTVNDLIEPPYILYQPLPRYTKDATDAGIEGTVLLEGIFRKNGLVTDMKVLQSLGHGLDESAIDTVAKEWRFEPARLKLTGQRVDVQAQIKVSFGFKPPKPPARPLDFPQRRN